MCIAATFPAQTVLCVGSCWPLESREGVRLSYQETKPAQDGRRPEAGTGLNLTHRAKPIIVAGDLAIRRRLSSILYGISYVRLVILGLSIPVGNASHHQTSHGLYMRGAVARLTLLPPPLTHPTHLLSCSPPLPSALAS